MPADGSSDAPRLPLRLAVWALHMALPLAGLWLLLARPGVDARRENHTAHFWLVLTTAAVALLIAVATWRPRHRCTVVTYSPSHTIRSTDSS